MMNNVMICYAKKILYYFATVYTNNFFHFPSLKMKKEYLDWWLDYIKETVCTLSNLAVH